MVYLPKELQNFASGTTRALCPWETMARVGPRVEHAVMISLGENSRVSRPGDLYFGNRKGDLHQILRPPRDMIQASPNLRLKCLVHLPLVPFGLIGGVLGLGIQGHQQRQISYGSADLFW